jgi:hypothetical protein
MVFMFRIDLLCLPVAVAYIYYGDYICILFSGVLVLMGLLLFGLHSFEYNVEIYWTGIYCRICIKSSYQIAIFPVSKNICKIY